MLLLLLLLLLLLELLLAVLLRRIRIPLRRALGRRAFPRRSAASSAQCLRHHGPPVRHDFRP
jgi:hypothetical protein